MLAGRAPLGVIREAPRPAPPAPQGAPLRGALAPAPHAPPHVFTQQPLTPFHEALRQAAANVQHAQTAARAQETPEGRRLEREQSRPSVQNVPQLRPGALGALLRQGHQEARQAYVSEVARASALQRLEREKEAQNNTLNLGFVNLSPIANAWGTAAQKLGIGQALGGVPGKVLNEAIDLPGQAFLSSVIAGGAAREALEGNTTPGQALLGSIAHQVTHPLQSAEQAPLSTALLFAGGEAGAGGILGRLGRLGERIDPETGAVLKEGLVPAFTKARQPLDMSLGSELAKQQMYNADPLRKALQVGYEKALTKLPGSLRQADPFQAEGWRLQHNLIGGWVHPGRVDYGAQASEGARRTFVKNTAVPTAEGLRPKVGAEAVPMFFDRTLRSPAHAPEDLAKREAVLTAERARIETQRTGSWKADLRQNADAIKQVQDLRKIEPAALEEAGHAANQAILHQRPLTAAEIAYGSLTGEQAARSPLFTYALAHMDAKHFSEADHAAAETQAAAAEREAQGRLAQLEPGSPEHAHAQREVQAARAHRYEVSGREGGPEAQALHESTVESHQGALAAVRDAEAEVQAAELGRARAVGAASRRPVAARATPAEQRAAEGGGTLTEAQTGHLRGAKERLAAAREAEVQRRGEVTPQPPINAALRTSEGRLLSNEAIEAHALAHGVPADENGRPLIGYLSHQTNRAGGGNFFRSVLRNPTLHRFPRTGANYLKGTNDHSFNGFVEGLARQASRVAQSEGRNALTQEYVRDLPHGTDSKAAQSAADNLNAEEQNAGKVEAGGWLPFDKGAQQIVDRNVGLRDVHAELAHAGLTEHTPAAAESVGKYGLIRKDVMDRLNKHQQAVSGGGIKHFFQAYTQAFRHVKFATSPKHAAGILEETAIRTLAEMGLTGPLGTGVERAVGGKVFGHLSDLAQADKHGVLFDSGPEGARFRRVQAELSGRGLVGSSKANDIVRKAGKWDETSALAKGAELTDHSPPMKAWLLWRKGTERALEQLPHQARMAGLGKVLKETGFVESAKDFLKAQDEGQRDLVARRMTPDKANFIARKLDDAYGNWTNLTPATKAAVSTVTPFGLWWLNSMRWLYRLPVTHPVKTALLASIYEATKPQRNAEGQGEGAAGVGTKGNPNYLQGTIPISLPGLGSVRLDLGHYSPFGVGGPEAPTTAAEMIGPQLEGTVEGLAGSNPLTHEKQTQQSGAELTPGQKALNALAELVSGPAAGATQAQQLLQGGGKPYGTANLLTDIASKLGGRPQVKPGTEVPTGQTLLKLLDPLKTYKASGVPGAGALTPAAARAVSRASRTPAFDEARIQRAIEASERRAAK